ncbi:hypothetical protein [Pseudomonas sp. GXZC]|uniref:hypothetical protein n=1 Tax=Pseudomonas sp. GXZC TaxID=3003351 RepID=UPI0022AB1D2A|nr:hypothetical protein [Pseudomonas sp. GXZC]WAT27708.1 hypothetical protein OZ428_27675 [Pseudomonas sp. GXZC]
MRDNDCGLLLVGLHSSGKTTLSQAFSSTGDYLIFELGDGVREIARRRSQTNLVRIASEILAGSDPVLLAKMAVAKARVFNDVVPVFVGARTTEERDYLVRCYPKLLVIGLNTSCSIRLARWNKRQMMATDKWEEREQWERSWCTELLVDESCLQLSGESAIPKMCSTISDEIKKKWGVKDV